jgi:formylglycine-generating enzyme required for sulfatase activity
MGWSCGRADDLQEKYAWYERNSLGIMHPVGILKPNDGGLFDLLGNAWEWTQERADEPNKDKDDIKFIKDKYRRVLRGGSYSVEASLVRCANRLWGIPSSRSNVAGFRPARTFR